MNKNIRILCLLLITIITTVSLTGCYDSNDIEDLAYVIAIGIDKADKKNFTLTFQTAVPKSIAGGEGESVDIKTYKTDNFLSGLKKASEYVDRKINLSHAKVLVVSEEIAKEGITAFLNGLQNNLELRPYVNIIVCKDGAQKFIESIQPKLSSSPAKYYELLFKSYETDFYVRDSELEDYLYRAKNKSVQPVAIYTAMDKAISDESDKKKSKEENQEDKESDGESKKTGEDKEKTMAIKGLAVFNMDKMVGKLNQDESMIYALMTSSKNKQIEIVDPLDKRFTVLSNVKKANSSSTVVTFKDGKPQININLKLNIDVEAVQSDNDYNDQEKAAKLEAAYEQYFNKGITDLLKKITKEYKSDILGFSQQAKRNFKTIDEWEKVKWQKVFPESEYNLSIDVVIRRQG